MRTNITSDFLLFLPLTLETETEAKVFLATRRFEQLYPRVAS